MKQLAYVAAGTVLAIALAAPARAEKNVILARTSPDVVIVWKVNDDLGGLAQEHLAPGALQNALIGRALGVMRRTVPFDAAPGETVTVKLVYFSTGGYDSNYKIETVSGVRRVGEISTTAAIARRFTSSSATRIAHGHLPSEVRATFAGDAFAGLTQ